MFKIIVLYLLFINPLLAFAEPRVLKYNDINFKEFAMLSAILNQCDFKGLDVDKEYISKSSKEEGLRLAQINNLSSENIAQEVATILYELDEKYPDDIPLAICMTTLKDFKFYLKKVKENGKK